MGRIGSRALVGLVFLATTAQAQAQDQRVARAEVLVVKPSWVWIGDGEDLLADHGVIIRGRRIEAVVAIRDLAVPKGSRVLEFPGATLIPGLIDAHTHLLLHPYDEASWNDQVLKESLALRVCRATNHLRQTLLSGFTTIRDLGTEGAGYADVGLRDAVNQGIVPGPRVLATTRAIVATGSYAPKGYAPELRIPQGAEEADGVDSLIRTVRDQIGKGADWIKVYADAAMGGGAVRPSFSLEELRLIVTTAGSAGVKVAVHAASREGMRRSALAGAATIEHGNQGDLATFRLMAERGVAFCPTLTAFEASALRQGYRPGVDPEPASLRHHRSILKWALESGVTIINGSDMGVFPHGQGARELELLVDYGMTPVQALKAATSAAARILELDQQIGWIKPGFTADLTVVKGNPCRDIKALRQVVCVVKDGAVAVP